MKWVFYVLVFVYMCYRAVYGVKVVTSITVDPNTDYGNGKFVEAGARKTINCKPTGRIQQLEWINPNGQVVSRLNTNRVFAQDHVTQLPRSRIPGYALIINHAKVEDSGIWQCRAGYLAQNVSVCVIERAQFINTLDEVTADEGRSYTLSCEARGNPDPIIYWSRDGNIITEDDNNTAKYRIMTKFNKQGKEGLLTIMSLDVDDSGIYTCHAGQESDLITDCVNEETFNITLNINSAPLFEEEGVRQKAFGKVGQRITLECDAYAYPAPTYRWFKKTGDDLAEISGNDIIAEGDESHLSVVLTNENYDKEYICRATNPLGEAEQLYQVFQPAKPSSPDQVEMTASSGSRIIFNVSWEEEVMFEVQSIEILYFSTTTRKDTPHPKESDWRSAKRVINLIDNVYSYYTIATLDDLEPETKYWVRLRILNDVGVSQWSNPILANTSEQEVETTTKGNETSDDDEDETSEESESDSSSSENFYGLFFAGGVLIIAIGCSFIARMV